MNPTQTVISIINNNLEILMPGNKIDLNFENDCIKHIKISPIENESDSTIAKKEQIESLARNDGPRHISTLVQINQTKLPSSRKSSTKETTSNLPKLCIHRNIKNLKRKSNDDCFENLNTFKSPHDIQFTLTTLDPNVALTNACICFDEKKHAYYLIEPSVAPIQNKFSVTELIKLVMNETFAGNCIATAIARQIINGNVGKQLEYSFIDPILPLDEIKRLILDNWRDKGLIASRYGTLMHATIENYYKTGVLEYRADLHREISIFIRFVLEYQLQPWALEYYVFNKELGLAGSIDGIFRSPTDNFGGNDLIIVDWKRSKDTDKFFSKKIFEGVAYEYSKKFQYSYQVNLYRLMLEKQFKGTKRVVGMFLWIIDPTKTDYTYEFYPVPVLNIVDNFMNRLLMEKDYLAELQRKCVEKRVGIYNKA